MVAAPRWIARGASPGAGGALEIGCGESVGEQPAGTIAMATIRLKQAAIRNIEQDSFESLFRSTGPGSFERAAGLSPATGADVEGRRSVAGLRPRFRDRQGRFTARAAGCD